MLRLRAGQATGEREETNEPQRTRERRHAGAASPHRVAENSAQPCAAPLRVFAPS
jgi:hypothetical protein